jgi:DNA-binding PadR family transcriptional regulator
MMVKKERISGIDLLLLGLLMDNPVNAYELANDIGKRHLDKLLKISKPAVYKNCKRLHSSGLLDGVTLREGEAPEKVSYSVNEAGKMRFGELMAHFSSGIRPFYFDHNAFLWNIDKLEKNEGLEMLEGLQTSIKSLKKWIVYHEKEVMKTGDFGGKALVKQYRMILETLCKWIDSVIEDFRLES